jgi:HAE1 family hydrophobic/amphiphilic exporter-1
MDLIRFAITKPVVVLVGVILVLLFGIIALYQLPYQLAPRIEKPVVSVRTFWAGASPYEIERDIVEAQEKVLKGLPNLVHMESESRDNMGYITLTFEIGVTMSDALLRVSNKLDEVPSYPENVDKPVLSATGSETDPIVMTALQALPGNPVDVYTVLSFFEENIQQYLERVPGVAEVQIRGGVRREMQVVLKRDRLAAYGISIDQVIAALRGDNVNVSAGNLAVGRREFRVRAVSEFRSEDDIKNVVVVSDGQRTVKVSDLADVRPGFEKRQGGGVQDGKPGIMIPIVSEPDANTLEVTKEIEQVVGELNRGILKDNGLELQWLDDQRGYIEGAIRHLREDIFLGCFFTVLVLWVFLRSVASTLVVSVAIPISLIGTFIVMRALGTTLNLVSLAGLAFATGRLVDDAIVVLENIDRHRNLGKTPFLAAYDGAREVWGAVLASTLTTVAVFVPVVFLKVEVGMMFRDIAIAVTTAVLISLVVSITVVPMLSYQLFSLRFVHWLEHRSQGIHPLKRVGDWMSAGYMALVRGATRTVPARLLTVAVLVAGSAATVYWLFPPLEYLPEGNRDSVGTMLMAPPGLSYTERMGIGKQAFDFMAPYRTAGYTDESGNVSPGIRRMFYVSYSTMMRVGMISADKERARDLIPIARKMAEKIPGVMGVTNQSSIFGRNVGQGRSVSVDLSGNDIQELAAIVRVMMERVRREIPNVQVRPRPELDLMYPETRFTPNDERLSAIGMTAQQFGTALDVLMDGRDIGDFKQEGEKKVNLVVKMDEREVTAPEELYAALIPTRLGQAIPISSLSTMTTTTGLTSIRHFERNRTFTLDVNPPAEMTIQQAMEVVNGKVVPQMRKEGLLEGIGVSLSGTADSLTQTRDALQWNFLLAMAITYLLMAALYGNFIYPLIIMFTVPLASAGGFIALKLVNLFITYQPMDVLTMLGFIIMVGVVVTNAILIVHQSLNNVRELNMDYYDAVIEATRSRLRPIYMTATTSIFALLPLVVRAGAGAELYRGLGAVVLGGLALSTVFTVVMIPAILIFFIPMEGRFRRRAERNIDAGEAVAK